MADYIKVSSSKMSADAEKLLEELGKLPEIIQDLESSIKTLSKDWQGEAWDAFQNQLHNDIDYLHDCYEMGIKYASAFSEAKFDYLKAERVVEDKISEVKWW